MISPDRMPHCSSLSRRPGGGTLSPHDGAGWGLNPGVHPCAVTLRFLCSPWSRGDSATSAYLQYVTHFPTSPEDIPQRTGAGPALHPCLRWHPRQHHLI